MFACWVANSVLRPPPAVMKVVLSFPLLLAAAEANQYDVLFPKYIKPTICTSGCATWSDVAAGGVKNTTQAKVAALFANGTIPAGASADCAMPGSQPVHGEGRRMLLDGTEEDSFMWAATGKARAGEVGSVPYCICKQAASGPAAPFSANCGPPMGIPEQINLQVRASRPLDPGLRAPLPPGHSNSSTLSPPAAGVCSTPRRTPSLPRS